MNREGRIAAVIVALALISSLAAWTVASNMNHVNSDVNTGTIGIPNGSSPPTRLTLHSPQDIQTVTGHVLILPNTTTLGPSYRVIGVSLDFLDLTATKGYQWSAMIYVWNGTFVNGTTTDSDIQSSRGVVIQEARVPSTVQLSQEALPQPPVHCVSFVKNGSSSCTTQTNTVSNHIVNQTGEIVLVNPQFHNLFLTYPAKQMVVTIYGGSHSVDEGLELAKSITTAATSAVG
jgi:hypothetical protein